MNKKKLIFDVNVISKFVPAGLDFASKVEIAYIVGKCKLDEGFLEFVNEETGYDGITAFGVFVMYLYDRYSECGNGDIENFLTEDFGVLFEDFKNECFIESEAR